LKNKQKNKFARIFYFPKKMTKRFKQKMPSKSLEALSIVVQHTTNEILINHSSLEQQKIAEQNKYWTKLNPGVIK
jgi:hypothetical protein